MRTLDETLLKTIAARLVAEFHPEEILLFGSHARGEAGEHSDLDILVIVSSSGERPTERASRAYRCLRGVMVPMDILVKTREEVERFRGVRASLVHRILERGKRVYGRGTALTGT